MRKLVSSWGGAAAMVLSVLAIAGCASTKESASKSDLTKDVGIYPPPPSGAATPRVGVPPFNVQATGHMAGGDLNDLAADQCTTLLDATNRFHVIERAQLKKLLDEQGLEGIVRSGELPKQANVRGVDYLVVGKVTNLRVKRDHTSNNFGAATMTGFLNIGGADVKNSETVVTTECGVDIRLVDPSTGEVFTSNFSDFKRTDSAKSMGLNILGASAESNADIQLSEDDKGQILRLALDDAIKKMLPKLDHKLKELAKKMDAPAGGTGAAQ